MNVRYARGSTQDQNIDLQLRALDAAGCEQVFRDQGVSGSQRDRPKLKQALAALSQGDSLVVWKLDRLGRSLGHLIELVSDLKERGRITSYNVCYTKLLRVQSPWFSP